MVYGSLGSIGMLRFGPFRAEGLSRVMFGAYLGLV